MIEKPENLVERIAWSLAVMPVAEDADAETKATHRELRARFEMNPNIRERGDAEPAPMKRILPPGDRPSERVWIDDDDFPADPDHPEEFFDTPSRKDQGGGPRTSNRNGGTK